MHDIGPARHFTCFLPRTSATGVLEAREDTKRVHWDRKGRSSKGMTFADTLEVTFAFG